MIHKFSQSGLFFVLDVPSGSVHIVDEAVYDIVDFFAHKSLDELIKLFENKHTRQTVTECYGEIDGLARAGLLFSKDVYEDIPLSQAGQPVVKALCMHIAHDCNLRCAYCFGGGGAFLGERALMPLDTARAAIDFLIGNSGGRKNLEVDFFGGEPLMNFDVVKQTVAYARQRETAAGKKFSFTLTTNGMLLNDDIIDYVNEHMDNVVLSLDGRKPVNDRFRKTASGGGSYETALGNFKRFTERRQRANYYIRATFTAHNLDFARDVTHLYELGFKRISAEPVIAPADCDYAIKESDIDAICAEYDRLTEQMLEIKKADGGFVFFHYNIDLTGGPCVYKRLAGCGAGAEYMSVTPDGSLYPCHQLAGNPKYILGNVKNGIINSDVRNLFSHSNVYNKPRCAECWAKFYCGGGCAASAININGDIDKPYEIGCALLKKRTECAIAYNYRLT